MKSQDTPAFLFDVDGTLIDSVYQHVVAWQQAFGKEGVDIPVWRIHRRIGMSGSLFVHALFREMGRHLTKKEALHFEKLHGSAYQKFKRNIHPLPGAKELLRHLSKYKVPWALATSGGTDDIRPAMKALGLPASTIVVTKEEVAHPKPDPDLFLAAAKKLGVRIQDSVVVGDSIWDLLAARRAHALGVGLLSGGYGAEELFGGGAFRVYQDPADLLRHLDDVGVHTLA